MVNNERIGLFDNNISRVDSLLTTTTALNKNGFAEAIDVDRIRVTLNNLKSERLKFLNLQSLSVGLLKFQMNYPMDKEIAVTGNLQDMTVNENLFNEYQEGWDYKNRIEYKVLDTQRKLQELDVKNKNSASHPSLTGFWNMGYSTQSPSIGGIFKTNTPISDNGMVGPDKWYSYSLYGVTLNIPLFSGLQRTYQTQQAKLNLLKIENSFISLRQNIDMSIQQNTTVYKNSIETLKSQQENMQLADRVSKITKIKYEQGVGSNIEVIDAESSLREAQVNYYNALFDALTPRRIWTLPTERSILPNMKPQTSSNPLNQMKNIVYMRSNVYTRLSALMLAALLAACSAATPETDKQARLEKLKTDQANINKEIKKLEEEIAKDKS